MCLFAEVLRHIPGGAARAECGPGHGLSAGLQQPGSARRCTSTGKESRCSLPRGNHSHRSEGKQSWGQEQAEVQAALSGAAGEGAEHRCPAPAPQQERRQRPPLTLTPRYRCSLLLHLAFFISERHLYQNRVLF